MGIEEEIGFDMGGAIIGIGVGYLLHLGNGYEYFVARNCIFRT